MPALKALPQARVLHMGERARIGHVCYAMEAHKVY